MIKLTPDLYMKDAKQRRISREDAINNIVSNLDREMEKIAILGFKTLLDIHKMMPPEYNMEICKILEDKGYKVYYDHNHGHAVSWNERPS